VLDPLLADLRRIYEGNAWHGPSVLEAIRDVSASQAAAHPVAGAHSIHELTHHVAAWIGEVTSRLQGNPPGSPADGDFPPPGGPVDDDAWTGACALLERRQAELIEAVAGFDPGRLDEPVNPTNRKDSDGPVSFRALLSGLAQHSAYHAGQMLLLKRALASAE
jgi:uncharacterized damage-inducible protein DinB